MITSRAIREFDPEARFRCEIAAAVLGAGALGAGAQIWGANTAANAQTNAANAAIANQQQMYANNQNVLSPFINAGASQIPQLQNWLSPTGGSTGSNPLSTLISLVTPGANQNATLQQTPGYQFAQQQGARQIQNSLAGRGLGGSPGAITSDIGQYSSGLASTNYNNIVQQLLQTFTGGAGAMQNLVNTGSGAGAALAGVGTNTANSITGSLTGAGSAQAAAANATGAAVGGLGNSASTAALLQALVGGNGSGGIYAGYSGPAYGGGNILTDEYGGNPNSPLPGLNPADYGAPGGTGLFQ